MSSTLSRRRLLQSVALVGLSACNSGSGGLSRSGPTSMVPSTELPRSGQAASALLNRQLERATFGVTAPLLASVSKVGFEAWLDAQLATDALNADANAAEPLGAVEAHLGDLVPDRAMSKELATEVARRSIETLTGRTILGAAFAEDQLRQRVLDVLADLLHVSSAQRPELFFMPDYDRMLRDGAFGRFSDLLVSTARHPAMLLYLDQARSRADGDRTPNENYAREVMELHTLGVDGGYDEGDVKELAHVMTGWSLDKSSGAFVFRSAWHDLGPMSSGGDIVGWRPSKDQVGEEAGRAALEHLARHRGTAERIAHLFARRFVSESIQRDDPLVEEAAAVYLERDTEIGPVVRHLLTSERFADSATLMVRRPIDLVAHTLRVTSATLEVGENGDPVLRSLVGLMRVLGQVPYAWPSPDGYPFGSAVWSNPGAMIGRWNAIVTLAVASNGGVVVLDPSALGAGDGTELVEALCGPEHQVY